MSSLLKSRNTLYIVLFFSVANLFSYLMMKQLDAVAFFFISGFITSYFSKNMIIVMLTSMISTFFLVQIKILGTNVQEGMVGAEKKDGEDKAEEVKEEDTHVDVMPTKTSKTTTTPPDAITTSDKPISKEGRATLTASKQETKGAAEKFTQKLNPARYNDGDAEESRHKPKIDYAATLESAYDNLDKLLSSDAIRNMASDTGRLAEKQQLLMGNIEKMTPIMEKAGSLLGNFDMSAITKLMGTVSKGIKDVDMSSLTSEVADNAEEVVKK